MSNTTVAQMEFDVFRYFDFDHVVTASPDGGGRIAIDGVEWLVTTSSAIVSDLTEPDLFAAVSTRGGKVPLANRYEVGPFPWIRSKIDQNPEHLNDTVYNDSNGDGLIDIATYDVTGALRNEFLLAPGHTATFVTYTVIADAVPLEVLDGSPKIVDVILSGVMWGAENQTWTREPYKYSDIVPEGKQLAPMYTYGVNTIAIQFSKHVRRPDGNPLDGSELKLWGTGTRGSGTARLIEHLPGGFQYDPVTFVATWTFPVLGRDKYRIDIEATGVESQTAELLDGHWENDWNGTLDDWTDDPTGRTFLTGNGVLGGSSFQFLFALLPGDYDQNGIVDASDEVLVTTPGTDFDGDGDGVGSQQGDIDVWVAKFGESLPFRKASWADYYDDDIVNLADYAVWRAMFGMTVDPWTGADGNGDGEIDAQDYVMWAMWADTVGAWFEPPGGFGTLIPIVDFGNPPKVANVTISGTTSTHDPYSFETIVGSGEQLRTVPVGGADTIAITFSEDVNVVASHLRVVGLRNAHLPTLAEFAYDMATMTATWRFNDLVANDHYILSLSDAVTDIEGNRLDGEWVNPATLSTDNPLVSVFPSGNGYAGGHFNFVFTLLAGDANLDLVVSMADYQILLVNWGGVGLVFTQGDFNGDGSASGADFNLLQQNFRLNLQLLWMLADLNGDYAVDELDLQILAQNMGMTDAAWEDGDLDGDGQITLADLELMFALYGLQLAVAS